MSFEQPLRVLEVGCGEAGVLKAFAEQGHTCVGIELVEKRIEQAKKLMPADLLEDRVRFIVRNIYDIDPERDKIEPFDLIILKDVIEHIPDQEKIIPELLKLARPNGMLFFAFPPWYMPFGGHQQIVKNKWLSKLPWIHLLPRPLYSSMLKLGGEAPATIQELNELKDTGISIERFESIARRSYSIKDCTMYLINPIYEYKFKLKKKLVPSILNKVPFLRNFYTTCVYFTLKNDRPKTND